MSLEERAKEIRKNILRMMLKSQTSHIGSCLSCVEILTILYFKILRIDSKNPFSEKRDRFVLSKGHAVASLYSTLALRGFFPLKELDHYCKDGEKMPGHSTKRSMPGVEVTTGALGHGLPMATGMALALKKDKRSQRVFVLMSDGECDEGSNWEAALFAGHHKLDNLTSIIDYNKLQAFGRTNKVLNLEPLAKKWEDFGWQVKEVDGHNLNELEKVLSKIPFKKGKPSLLISHTVKGRGVSFMENKMEWHYKNLTDELFEKAIKEIS